MPRFLVALPVVALSALTIGVVSQPGAPTPPAPSTSAGALISAARLGLSPHALAAAEANASVAGGLLADLAASPQVAAALRSVDDELSEAQQSLATIVDICQRGGATPERLTERAELTQLIASLEAQRESGLVALRGQVSEALTSRVGADRAALAMRLAANSRRDVAEHHRALDLSEEGWRTLESATLKVRSGLPLTASETTTWAAAEGSSLAQTVAARQLTIAPALQTFYIQQAQAIAQP